jgi:uncharacterized alkaline shock family protein YloU
MAEYVYIENYSKNGKMGISHVVFDQIASISAQRVKGVSIRKNSKVEKAFKLNRPIECQIKNGVVNVNIDVIISHGHNVNEICLLIQEEVSSALSSLTELVPININVRVKGIE